MLHITRSIVHNFLLSPRLPGKSLVPTSSSSRLISNYICVYLFLNSEPQLGKSKEFNNQGMKVQVNKDFKTYYFLSPKKEKKQ